MKIKKITMILSADDLFYIKYALEERIAIWTRTVTYFREGDLEGEIEEANSEHEAKSMVEAYTNILKNVKKEEAKNDDSMLSVEVFRKVINKRISYWQNELEDVKSELMVVKSIREEDAECMLSEYEWISEQLKIII